MRIEATPDGLAVNHEDQSRTLSWRWVLDHGEDDTSFNHQTKQRRVDALGPVPAAATSAQITTVDGLERIIISWPDRDATWISVATLTSLLDGAAATTAIPWHTSADAPFTVGTVQDVLADDDALRTWVSDIARYGFGRLRGFSGGHDEVSDLANRIGYVQATIFGTTWDLASDVGDHQDTAYSETFLAPHTDGTYSHDAPGLQMFCCTERTGTGGESIVVDGLAIAETLRKDYPEHFDVLTSVNVPGHYIEPGIEVRAERPAIRLDDGAFAQISLNNYDRSPMLLDSPQQMEAFYLAYSTLNQLASDRSRWCAVRLEPGDVLINDNWRVLHGREAYTGARRFVGCYLNHQSLESRVRTLGVS